MKRSKFTDSQIIDALKRADAGLAVPDVCRELGISSVTFYKWRAKYGGMDAQMTVRMKELGAENARFKKMYIKEKLKAENLLLYADKLIHQRKGQKGRVLQPESPP